MNFSTVPPEPLERAAKPLVIRAKDRLDVLGIELLRAGGEADEVREQDRDHLPLPTHALHRLESTSGSRGRQAPSSRAASSASLATA